MKDIIINNYKKMLIILAVAIAVGLLGEVFFNLKSFTVPDSEKGKISIALDSLETDGFQLVDGKLVMTGDTSIIKFRKTLTHVCRFEYTYTMGKDYHATIRYYPSEQNLEDGNYIAMYDGNNRAFTTSESNIDSPVAQIEVIFESDAKGVVIEDVSIDNSFNFSHRRMLAVSLIVIIVMFLILYRDLVGRKIEYGFLMVAFCSCIALIYTFPAQKVSWDEAYHFNMAYNMGIGGDRIVTPETAYFGSEDAVSTLMYPLSEVEFDSIEDYMDSSNLYDKDDRDNQVVKAQFGRISNIGHLPSSIGISIGRLFKLPLSDLYYLGKLFNALTYIAITFLAIRKITVGKRMLTAIALMPTLLFLASVYSYDAVLNAVVFLGLAYYFSELTDRDKYMSWKSFVIFVATIGVASAIKMVYAPLFLLLLTLPKEKFKDKKSMIIMKYGIFIACIAVVAVMIVPLLLNPSTRGDSRGGAVDAGGQLAFIFGQPLSYAKILVGNILSTGSRYLIGDGIFGTMAHYSNIKYGGYISIFLAFVIITDSSEHRLSLKLKSFLAVVVLVVVCFVWTALYISYNPVGSLTINGVQGRYFIPITLLLYLIINTDKIKNEINPKLYHALVAGVPAILTFSIVMYKVISYCA